MASAVIGALRVNLGIDSANFTKGAQQAQSAMARFGTALKVGAVAAAAGVGAAIGSMGLAMKGAIDAADELSKASAKIGIPIDELSRLKYAADLSGISFETLQQGVKKLSVNMAAGGKEFAKIGVSLKNADGTMKSASTVMTELADKFAAMPDGAEKTALAIKLFGKAGAEMIPLLNGGSVALGNLMKEADSFGQVFTEQMGKDAEAFNDNITRLQGAFGALAASLAQKALPYLVQFTDWMVANVPAIADFLAKVGQLALDIIDFGAAVVQLGADLVAFTTGAWSTFEQSWNNVVERVNAVKQSLIDLGSAGLTAMQQMVDGITQWLGQKLTAVFDSVAAKVEYVKGAFADLYDAVVGNSYIPDMVDGIGYHMGRLDQEMVQPVNAAVGQIESTFSSWLDSAIKGTFDFREALAGLARQLLEMAANKAISNLLGSLFGGGSGGYAPGYVNTLPFGGMRAMGGAVNPRSAYLVGERGPELFVPNGGGSIVPNGDFGGGTVINIDARGAQAGVGEEIRRALAEYDRGSYGRHVSNTALARKRGDMR